MPTEEPTGKQWYVLNFVSRGGTARLHQVIDRFNQPQERVELFAPIMRRAVLAAGKVIFREKLLTYFYIFVRGTLGDVKELCAQPDNGLSLMLNRGSQSRYATISDSAMESFKVLTRAYTNTIPIFDIADVDLQAGDKVEIVAGQYAGLTGTYMPKPRSNRGNVVLAVTSAVGAVVWNVEAKYVRILEFAPASRRQYDLLDAYIPHLVAMVDKFKRGEELTDGERTRLTVFNSRMGLAHANNPKFEAKLLAALATTQFLLGDTKSLPATLDRYNRLSHHITNPNTLSLTTHLLSLLPR